LWNIPNVKSNHPEKTIHPCHIETGIEIVPIKELAEQMSSGVSYFEQFVWDLEKRGVSNIDVPALIIGIGR
jgi:hypothetical protein